MIIATIEATTVTAVLLRGAVAATRSAATIPAMAMIRTINNPSKSRRR